MIIFAKICISIHYTDFILQNVQPAKKMDEIIDYLGQFLGH